MANNTFADNIKGSFLERWDGVAKARKPIIAAVNGYAVINLNHHSYATLINLKSNSCLFKFIDSWVEDVKLR